MPRRTRKSPGVERYGNGLTATFTATPAPISGVVSRLFQRLTATETSTLNQAQSCTKNWEHLTGPGGDFRLPPNSRR